MEICSTRGIAENLDVRECAVHHGVTIPSRILLRRTRLGVASRRERDVAKTPFECFSVHVKAGMPRCFCKVGAGEKNGWSGGSDREQDTANRERKHRNSGQLLNRCHRRVSFGLIFRRMLPHTNHR